MKILLPGGVTGFVGRNLARHFAASGHEVIATRQADLSIGNEAQVRAAIAAHRPDVLVNAAGDKNLVLCEEDGQRAMQVNAFAPAMLARVCGEMGVRFCHIGSDHAYALPFTSYGESKRNGDDLVMEANPAALVAVTGHVYANDCPWIRWLDGELRAGRTVEAWADIYNWPTYAPNLADMVLDMLATRTTGIRLCLGSQRVNRYELFQWYAVAAGLDASLVVRSEIPCPSALHPRDFSLSKDAYVGRVRRVRVAEGMQMMCGVIGKAVAA